MGKRFQLSLTTMAHGGEAIGRHEGKATFVPYVIPGEDVLVEAVEDKRRYTRARLVKVLSPSPHRIEPLCPHFGECGGCHWQHIAYQAQLDYKREIVRDQLAHIGHLSDVPIKPMIPSPSPWHYRNHVRFSISENGRLGYQKAKSRQVVPIEECPLLHPLLEELFAALDLDLPGLRRLSLRAGANTGDRMIIFETEGDEPPELEVDMPISCVLLLSDGTPVNLIGSNYITEVVAGRRFRISAVSFFRANTAGAKRLSEVATDYLQPRGDEVLLDAYCGVGTFGLLLADKVAQVIGVEENPSAVADADFNAGQLENLTLIEGRVEDVLPHLEGIDAAILDPPRGGCEPEALKSLKRSAPQRIIYISRDPAVFARDASILHEAGYQLLEVQPLDMLPQTYHIESVSLFRPGRVAPGD
ncbi:MAG: class I SAM-dependent RNA methyltransferase [Chloroflexota bacterium]|nr:class I SAM-dependent RNA methyltransferase [Chloroflexota bacterium]